MFHLNNIGQMFVSNSLKRMGNASIFYSGKNENAIGNDLTYRVAVITGMT